ncbi:MAG TPA: toprim domain-containing protein [Longimicrobium sp.]
MSTDPLPFPTEAELLAASGYPFQHVRVRYRPPLSWHPLRDGSEVARYLYTGEDGEPRLECIRVHLPPDHPAAPDKAFLWRHMAAGTGWRWGLGEGDAVLYRLARVRAAAAAGERVWVVEGEKDVHALEALGLTATTAPLGALQWTEAYAEALRGAEVVVIPDADRAGWVHAARVIATLRGRARSASLLLLPVEPKGDVSDWIAQGNGAAELARLADAAPRDPSDADLAALLELPPGVDPLSTTPQAVHALLAGAARDAAAPPEPHPAFRRSVAAFARLGVAVRPETVRVPPDAGLPEPHPTWRAIVAALRDAGAGAAALLDDASLLERASYELALFARLLRAAMAGDAPGEAADPAAADTAFATAPSVRLVRTRWEWDAFLADPAQAVPAERGATWVLHLSPSGPVQMRRLHPLPALVLEACAQPHTRDALVAVVAEQVEGDPARLAAMVHAQVDELRASGLLRPFAPTAAEHAVGEMQRLLLDDDAVQAAPRTLVGVLARTVRPTRERAEEAPHAADGSFPLHRLDTTVNQLDQLLTRIRLRHAFSTELDGYWAGVEVPARVAAISPLLEVLDRALGSGVHRLPPYVISP